jgi:ParB/RepB/Spo0J family partition protein
MPNPAPFPVPAPVPVPVPPAAPAPQAPIEVPLDRVVPDPDQPRRSIAEDRLHSLAASIRSTGLIQPLVVRPHPDPKSRPDAPYMLLAGERRWLAARRAGLAAVPVFVRHDPLSDSDRLMLQIDENDPDLCENLPLFDLARAVTRAFELSGCTQTQFAQRHRRSQAWLSQLLVFAHSDGLLREALEENFLRGILAARTFIRLPTHTQRRLLAEARRDHIPITLARAEHAATILEHRREQREHRDSLAAHPGTLAGATEAADPDANLDTDPNTDPNANSDPDADADPQTHHSALHQAEPTAAAPAGTDFPPAASSPPSPPEALDDPGASPAIDDAPPHFGPPPGLSRADIRALPTRVPPPPIRRPRDPGAPFTIALTPDQLEALLILLGIEPADSIADQIGQLFACL